jgi:drug/metabolite transporter (DMT)-like permease
VIIATTPFWMVGVEAWVPGGERLTWRHLTGLLLGFLGIVLLVGPSLLAGGLAARHTIAGVVALQIACAAWAVGSAYGKRHGGKVSPAMSAAMQMAWGGLIMLAAGTLHGEWPLLRFTASSAAALAYLAIFGSLGAFAAYMFALTHLPVSIVSLYAYVNPIIAVALGTLLLGEPFDARMVAGIVVILLGLATVSSARRSPHPDARDDGPPALSPELRPARPGRSREGADGLERAS